MAQHEDIIRRTVYVSDIDHQVKPLLPVVLKCKLVVVICSKYLD